MDVHGNARSGHRKEISCSDCGHVYLIAAGQQSSRCTACGNIAFHLSAEKRGGASLDPAGLRPAFQQTEDPAEESLAFHHKLPAGAFAGTGATTVLPKPAVRKPARGPDPAEILARFAETPNGQTVQAYLVRYQVEWQLWAKLTENFADVALHAAYLSHVTSLQAFDEATARYRDHRAVMSLGPDTHWEAEVSELMLQRLERLTTLRMEQAGADGFRLPVWLYLLPLQSGPFRIAWITLGMLSVAKFFHYI